MDEQERAQLKSKAIKVLKSRETVPYDETQALLVCTTKGFVDGFVLIYELLGMYEDIVRCKHQFLLCGFRSCGRTQEFRCARLDRYLDSRSIKHATLETSRFCPATIWSFTALAL